MADISRQVRARIRSETRDSRWEEDRRAGEASTVQAKVSSDEKLDGIQVVETAQDGNTWYALATLQRSDLAAPGRTAMEESSKDAIDRMERLRMALAANRPQEAAEELSALDADRSKFLNGRESAALGEPDARSREFPLSAPVRDSFSRVLRTGLELSAPDTVVVSREHPESVVLDAKASWKGSPVADLDLELVGPGAKILAAGRTGSAGEAKLRPQQAAGDTWILRVRPGALAASERKIEVRWTGSVKTYRLSTDRSSLAWKTDLALALTRSGWTLDSIRGQSMSATLKTSPLGELDGMGGALVRYQVKAVLRLGDREITCNATASGSGADATIKAAVRKLDCPVP
jgi:hypothetical protein